MKLFEEFGTVNLGPGFFAGIEYEIEDIKDSLSLEGSTYRFQTEGDNSLRNNGHEFKTGALSFQNALDSFGFLHKRLKLGKNPFSERTSTHVHVNVGHLNQEQAKNFILTYALLEPLFFRFAGQKRQENIFCVPLNYTCLPGYYSSNFVTMLGKWHKYAAFNILPTKSFGTFEFRHLGGTGDFERFSTWLTSLKNIYDSISKEGSINILEYLAKDGDIYQLAKETIPLLSDLSKSQMEQLLYDSVLDVKLASGGY